MQLNPVNWKNFELKFKQQSRRGTGHKSWTSEFAWIWTVFLSFRNFTSDVFNFYNIFSISQFYRPRFLAFNILYFSSSPHRVIWIQQCHWAQSNAYKPSLAVVGDKNYNKMKFNISIHKQQPEWEYWCNGKIKNKSRKLVFFKLILKGNILLIFISVSMYQPGKIIEKLDRKEVMDVHFKWEVP